MTDTITNLLKDLNIASDLMADTDTFPTGQAIMRDATKTIAALQAENAKLREALATENSAKMRLRLIADQLEDGEPEYHEQGMGCGLEDRNITDRYQAMEFGWAQAMERVFDATIRPAIEALLALSVQDAEGET